MINPKQKINSDKVVGNYLKNIFSTKKNLPSIFFVLIIFLIDFMVFLWFIQLGIGTLFFFIFCPIILSLTSTFMALIFWIYGEQTNIKKYKLMKLKEVKQIILIRLIKINIVSLMIGLILFAISFAFDLNTLKILYQHSSFGLLLFILRLILGNTLVILTSFYIIFNYGNFLKFSFNEMPEFKLKNNPKIEKKIRILKRTFIYPKGIKRLFLVWIFFWGYSFVIVKYYFIYPQIENYLSMILILFLIPYIIFGNNYFIGQFFWDFFILFLIFWLWTKSTKSLQIISENLYSMPNEIKNFINEFREN